MEVILKNPVPRYFTPSQTSEVWNQEIVLVPGIHVISGQSGRGKSSLLNWIGRSRQTCMGTCAFQDQGRLVSPLHIPYLDQGLLHIPHLSAWDNIILGLLPQGQDVHDPGYLQMLRGLCADWGLTSVLENPAKTLSRGELQRLLLLTTLVQPSSIYIADEPFAHVNEVWKRKAIQSFLELPPRGTCVIISSLDPDLDSWLEQTTKSHEVMVRIWNL